MWPPRSLSSGTYRGKAFYVVGVGILTICETDTEDSEKPSILESDAVIWEDGVPRFRMEVLGNSIWAIRKAEEAQEP